MPATASKEKARLEGLLTQVVSTGRGLRPFMVFHGPEKVGKTSLAAQAKNPFFLMSHGEVGLETLIDHGQLPTVPHLPELKSWLDLIEAIQALTDAEHSFDTLVLDTMNGFESMLYEYICHRDYGGEWGKKGFMNFQEGFRTSTPVWKEMLRKLDTLREKRDMSVIGLCHTEVKSFKNPAGQDYDQYRPQLHTDQWGALHKCADLIGFINTVVVVDEDGARAKGKGGTERWMYCQNSAAAVAGNRLGMTQFPLGTAAPIGWKNLNKNLKEAKKNG